MTESIKPTRIDRIKISNYKFFHGDFELAFNGNNALIYGENGSGKSSIYRAIEFLTKPKFESIGNDRNIFTEEGDALIEFSFTDGNELIIHSELEELPPGMDYLKGLSIFTPILDYKKLLNLHYSSESNSNKINVYEMLRRLFKNYPIGNGVLLSEIKEPDIYFSKLKSLINDVLLSEVNSLIKYFEADFHIHQFNFKTEFTADGRLEPIINIEIDFRENVLESYHTFLNEARLSAMAVSVYFAAILKLLGTLESESLKILVLDDLLISLDMSNRLKLLEILKDRFTDFQIFFFTHDKELFEIYKNKMSWENYELYLDDTDAIPKAIVKKGSSFIERAKEFYARKEYDCCALLLRKGFENTLKSYLTIQEQRDRNCNDLDLAGLIGKAISKSSGEVKAILEKLNVDRKHILNPLSHRDDRTVYAQELKTAMSDLEKLNKVLK